MKKRVLIGLIIVVTLSIIGGTIYFYYRSENINNILEENIIEDLKENKETIIEDDNIDIKEVDNNKEEIIKPDNKENDTNTTKQEVKKNNSTSNNNSNKSTSNTKKEEKKEIKQNSDNKEVNNKPKTNTVVEPKEEKKEEPRQEEKHYIGVPDPNSLNYSFHHGKIEYKNMDICINDSYRVMEKNLDDIYSSWCIEVNDENSTVLGAYLMIKCYSGNCNKYKD